MGTRHSLLCTYCTIATLGNNNFHTSKLRRVHFLENKEPTLEMTVKTTNFQKYLFGKGVPSHIMSHCLQPNWPILSVLSFDISLEAAANIKCLTTNKPIKHLLNRRHLAT